MQVGTVIKAFDFPDNVSCYMVGEVTAFDDCMIYCRTVRQVVGGKDKEINDFNKIFRTFQQGQCWFDSSFQRIVEIG